MILSRKKSVIHFNESFKKVKRKLEIIVILLVNNYRSAAHNKCNIKNVYYFLSFFTIFTVSSNYHKPRAQSTVFVQLMKSTFHFQRK